jgi:hypothetical protein
MTRDELVSLAQNIATGFPALVGDGLRIVVLVCDEPGDYVGVGMTTGLEDALAMMRLALAAKEPPLERVRFIDGGPTPGFAYEHLGLVPKRPTTDAYPMTDVPAGAQPDSENHTLLIGGLKPLFLPSGLRHSVRLLAQRAWSARDDAWLMTQGQRCLERAMSDYPLAVAYEVYRTVDEKARAAHAPELPCGGIDDDEFAVAFAAVALSADLIIRLVTWEASRHCWRMGVKVQTANGPDEWAMFATEGLVPPSRWPHPRWETDDKVTYSPLVKP